MQLLTTAILPTGTSEDLSSQNVVPSPSAQVSDSYTATLAEKTFGFVPRTDGSEHQGMTPVGRQSNSVPVPAATKISADSFSQRPIPTATTSTGKNIYQGSPGLTATESLSASTPFPMFSGMHNTPFVSGGITESDPLQSTFVQDYGIGGNDYGYMVDGTGPIDFSDMIGDLFASEGLL